MMRYLSFFRMRFLAGLQYRVAALAGICTQFVWGGLELLLYRALYLSAPELLPMDMQALASYIWLQQAFLSLFASFMWEQELFQAVQSGTVAYELLRPAALYGMWSARCFALRMSRAALRAGPVLFFAVLLPAPYGLRVMVSAATLLQFLFSMVLMLWVVVAMCMVYYSMSFFLIDAMGFTTLMGALSELLSGSVLPLPFFPDKLQLVAEFSPFGAMQNVPFRIFGGDIAGMDIWASMGLQLFWAVVLTIAGKGLMEIGIRRTVIAGG